MRDAAAFLYLPSLPVHGTEKAEIHTAVVGEMGLDFVPVALHVGRRGLADYAL
jgi:hypothetical protein